MKKAFLALLAVLTACDAKPPGPVVTVTTLQSLDSASGGRLVLVPAGAAGPFYIDVHPVTQELYQKQMGVNPSKQKNPAAPVAG